MLADDIASVAYWYLTPPLAPFPEPSSVEVPLTDFFAVGQDLYAPVNSLAVIVNPKSALTTPCVA